MSTNTYMIIELQYTFKISPSNPDTPESFFQTESSLIWINIYKIIIVLPLCLILSTTKLIYFASNLAPITSQFEK